MKAMMGNERDGAVDLLKEGRRKNEEDIIHQNRKAHLRQKLNHQSLKAILIPIQLLRLMSVLRVMTGIGSERNIPSETNISMEKERGIGGEIRDAGSMTGN